ncbi:MAG: hypothetical protein FWF92_02095 [Oscillospiraceae bacterium]|nr:hypothetical protein [Oscillospiraceae bacterium]
MDWKRYWNELLNSIGAVSLILLFAQLIMPIFSDIKLFGNFEIGLLMVYIISAVFIFLTYHLFPKIITNFHGRRKLFYTVVVIELTGLYTLTDIIFNLINLQERKLINIFWTIPFLLAALTITYIIVYFAQNAHYKRMNKKLDEYKQKNDDDTIKK